MSNARAEIPPSIRTFLVSASNFTNSTNSPLSLYVLCY